jgi:hypothetical protein
MISDADLLEYNRRGLIPGPEEDEDAFLQRVSSCHRVPAYEHEGREKVKAHFDIDIDWMEVSYSNKGLMPWEGAAVLISESRALLQLRKAFEKGAYLGLYMRSEVLSHEWAHLARMAFHEPQFEELFAYSLSSSSLRRRFGPFFRTSCESSIFLAIWLISLILNAFQLFTATLAFSLPLLVTAYGFWRLARLHLLFQRCRRSVSKIVKEPKNIIPLLFRQRDTPIQPSTNRRDRRVHSKRKDAILALENDLACLFSTY